MLPSGELYRDAPDAIGDAQRIHCGRGCGRGQESQGDRERNVEGGVDVGILLRKPNNVILSGLDVAPD